MATSPLQIDGSHGEGGGQILRSTLALAIITQQPVRITRIRAGRAKPGLMRQHLAAARAAAAACGGALMGDQIGSTELSFTPGPVTHGDHRFAVGSAGSATLVLQTVLPALLLTAAGQDARRTGFQPVAGPQGRTPNTPTTQTTLTRRQRNLPHWEKGGATYAVAFRVKDGHLTEPERQTVLDACSHWHGERLDLHLAVVMPDHVHLLFTPRPIDNGDGWYPLPELLHSIKSLSATTINRARGTQGALWQADSYDRLVRDEQEFADTWEYLRQNPVRAGLVSHAADYAFMAEGEEQQANGLEARSTGRGTHVGLCLEGGTHNPYAPPFDFLDRVYLPHLRAMGADVHAQLERPGFYPAGGGCFTASVTPTTELSALDLTDRGAHVATRVTALLSNLPETIGEREIKAARKHLGSPINSAEVVHAASHSPGNAVMIEVEHERARELFVAFGEKNRTAERVARQAAQQAKRYLNNPHAAAGEYLADQLLLPMALAADTGGGAARSHSTFTTYPLAPHATTQIDLLAQFLPHVPIRVTDHASGAVRVTVGH